MKDVNLLIGAGVNVRASLDLFGDMETYNDSLETFLEEIDKKVADMKKYKEVADMANYAILVHSLKSDAKYFGFELLADLAYKHELESKANNIYFVYDNFDSLMAETDRIVKLVKEYFGAKVDIVKEDTWEVSKDKAILVVDDSNVISNFIKKIFDDRYEVIVAHDGAEAINAIKENTKLIGMLLDLNMPNVNGFEVLRFMGEDKLFEQIPVAIITGVCSDEVINQVKLYPVTGILRKPFNEKDVKDVVEKIVRYSELKQA